MSAEPPRPLRGIFSGRVLLGVLVVLGLFSGRAWRDRPREDQSPEALRRWLVAHGPRGGDQGPRPPKGSAPGSGPAKLLGAFSDLERAALQAQVDRLAQPPLGTGAALTVVRDGQRLTLTAGLRWAEGPPVTAETRFNVASVSKLFTAARVLSLVAEGRLGLRTPLQRALPGVRLVDAGGADRTAEVSLARLLDHTSGLPTFEPRWDPRALGSDWHAPGVLSTLTEMTTLTLAHPPGRYGYSNLGYALLGAAVERATGLPFAEAMDVWLRSLPGLATATFTPEAQGNDAHGRVVRDGVVRFLEAPGYSSQYAAPFTGLFLSMPALAAFGERLLAAAADPQATLHPMTRFEGQRGHGLGPVFRLRAGARSLEHDGGGPGFLAWLLVVPAHRLVVAVACNGDGDTPGNARALFEVTEALVAALVPPAPEPSTPQPSTPQPSTPQPSTPQPSTPGAGERSRPGE